MESTVKELDGNNPGFNIAEINCVIDLLLVATRHPVVKHIVDEMRSRIIPLITDIEGQITLQVMLLSEQHRITKLVYGLSTELQQHEISLDNIDLDSLPPVWGDRKDIRFCRKELILILQKLNDRCDEISGRLLQIVTTDDTPIIPASTFENATSSIDDDNHRFPNVPSEIRTDTNINADIQQYPSSYEVGSVDTTSSNEPPLISRHKRFTPASDDNDSSIGQVKRSRWEAAATAYNRPSDTNSPLNRPMVVGDCQAESSHMASSSMESSGSDKRKSAVINDTNAYKQVPSTPQVNKTSTGIESGSSGNSSKKNWRKNKKVPVDWLAKMRETLISLKRRTAAGSITSLADKELEVRQVLPLLTSMITVLSKGSEAAVSSPLGRNPSTIECVDSGIARTDYQFSPRVDTADSSELDTKAIVSISPSDMKRSVEVLICGFSTACTELSKHSIHQVELKYLHSSALSLETAQSVDDLIGPMKSLEALLKTFGGVTKIA